MIVHVVIALLGGISYLPSTTQGFVPSLFSHKIPQVIVQVPHPRFTPTTLFENKLWDRMEIEEDDEPMWYVLNCVAGLEIDLLRQCRQRCEGMEDVVKFVVPMVTNTRSHGANRMVKDIKVKYQGYVFAKLRLCPQTYEAIQGLDLCRSWMGTINYKGMKKLPPAPVALNEEEIENFGLDDCEDTLSDETEEEDVILDTAEADQEAAEFEETIQKVYLGLRVNDMVKITAKNKFFDEDAIVRRLKDGKVFLRFYTYGSMYEEWMNPGDVRKLSNIEILKGLSGPQQPITQRDIDGPSQGDRRRSYDDDQRPGDIRRNLQDSFGGGPRSRREDRAANQFQRDADRDRQQSDEKWNKYKDGERRNQGGAHVDGAVEIRGSERQEQKRNNRDDKWAQGDVDSQWGRTSQRQDRRDKRQVRPSNDGGGDWNAFVSPSKQRPTQDETDDFFASLMTDLSNDLESERGSKGSSKANSNSGSFSSSEDDFFASLISEIEGESPSSPQTQTQKPNTFTSDEDDFFASLVEEIQNDIPQEKPSKSARKNTQMTPPPPSPASDESDFFTELAKEIDVSPPQESPTKRKTNVDELDDFFSELESSVSSDADDFFAGLETEVGSELSISVISRTTDKKKPAKQSATKKKPDKSTSPAEKQVDVSSLDKCTVPELKEMLREKGLKVTGKKAELIERLAQT